MQLGFIELDFGSGRAGVERLFQRPHLLRLQIAALRCEKFFGVDGGHLFLTRFFDLLEFAVEAERRPFVRQQAGQKREIPLPEGQRFFAMPRRAKLLIQPRFPGRPRLLKFFAEAQCHQRVENVPFCLRGGSKFRQCLQRKRFARGDQQTQQAAAIGWVQADFFDDLASEQAVFQEPRF